ncbi:ATP/GTP-binding protein [Streptosporangium lutulentum]
MLLRFRVANHRSLREEAELSLVATEFNEGTARSTGVKSEGREISVVPLIGIFGANGSGKSNTLAAIRAMRSAVRGSVLEWARETGVPREPFALDPRARDETTLFEVDLILGESPVRYTYGFELSDERVEAEWLHAYPHGRKQVWFDREADRAPEEGGEFRFPGDGLKGAKNSSPSSPGRTRCSSPPPGRSIILSSALCTDGFSTTSGSSRPETTSSNGVLTLGGC